MERRRGIIVLLCLATATLGVWVLLMGILFLQTHSSSMLVQQTFIGRIGSIRTSVRSLDSLLDVFYRGPKPTEELPLYVLDLDSSDLEDIAESLPRDDVFLNEDATVWAKGTFWAEGQMYPIRARVRGDRYNHWAFAKKSWRIEFTGPLYRGMSELNLIIPEDRAWFGEALNAFRAKNMGLPTPPTRFVLASMNGSKPMLYMEIEHWTKEMVEKLAYPGDVNFYQTGAGPRSHFTGWVPLFENSAYWGKYLESVASPTNSYEELDLLLALSRPGAHSQPGYAEKIQSLFNVDTLVRWYAHSLLSGNFHVSGDNLRLFFDVSRGRFQPFAWDVFLTPPSSLALPPGNELWNEVFAIPQWRHRVHEYLWEYVQNEETVAADIAEAQRLRALIERAAYKDPFTYQSNRLIKRDLDKITNYVQANIDFIRTELQVSEVAVERHIPLPAEQARGVVAILDISTQGISAALLSGATLPEGIQSVQIFKDTGDGVWNAADTSIPLRQTARVVRPANRESVLLWTVPVETNEAREIISVPRAHYRFFLVSSQQVPASAWQSLTLDIRNAVTGAPATVLQDVWVSDAATSRALSR